MNVNFSKAITYFQAFVESASKNVKSTNTKIYAEVFFNASSGKANNFSKSYDAAIARFNNEVLFNASSGEANNSKSCKTVALEVLFIN